MKTAWAEGTVPTSKLCAKNLGFVGQKFLLKSFPPTKILSRPPLTESVGHVPFSAEYNAIGSRRMEHPCGDDERGRSDHFDRSRRWERRVIGGGEGMQGSEEGDGSRKRRGENQLPWMRIDGGGTVTLPTGR